MRGVGSGFGKWMQKTYPECFETHGGLRGQGDGGGGRGGRGRGGRGTAGRGGGRPVDPQRTQLGTYDHVYVDVNNVLHVAAHHTKTEEAFFKKLFALLDRTMRLTRPQYTVTLALDGPAPIAKTITQRRRRIRLSSGEKVPLSEDAPRLLKIGLTPGSTLALRIDRALEYYAATRLLSRNHLPRGVLFEISGTRVPGEGEVKVLRSMKTREKNARFKGHSHLIVSEDSDALLLALTAEPANVFVLSSKLVFSAAAFNASLADELPRGVGIAGARRDFVALAVMMGNDYLPGSRFGVKYSWRAYRQLRTGEPGPWITVDEEEELLDPADGDGVDVAIPSSSNHSVAKDVAWGKYRDTPLFPSPTERDLSEDVYRWGDGHARGAAFTAGKMAFRHPPPVHWEMLRDFSKVLSDPEYVKRQVHDGLRPRADVQRSVNAAAALVAWFGDDDDDDDDAGDDDDDDDEDEDDDDAASSSSSAVKAAVVEPRVANVAGVGGVLRASADPQQSTRRAYEYVQAVGWVLEMYYAGACLDYGYNFVYPTTDSKSDMSEADLNEATKATLAAAAAAAKVAPGGGGGNSANNGNNSGNNAANANPGGRTQLPPVHPVDVADFISIPLTYDPTLDPLRDPERASIAYLNRFPITPLAYSLAVIPRGGRSLLARGVRPLVDPGSPVYHLFRDDYCVTCIKHRITAGPLERVIQREAEGGGGGGGPGGIMKPRSGMDKDRIGSRAEKVLLAKKFAGGDEEIRKAARAGGDVAKEFLRKLNRRHLTHMSTARQHEQDKPPPPLNDLEGAVARASIDGALSEDEETIRTLADQPVLIWHHGPSSDPPGLDSSALTAEDDIPAWATTVAPPGCRHVGKLMREIRRYDGDASAVVSRWAVGGERAPAPRDVGGGGGRGGGGRGGQRDGGGGRGANTANGQGGGQRGRGGGRGGGRARGWRQPAPAGAARGKEKEKENAAGIETPANAAGEAAARPPPARANRVARFRGGRGGNRAHGGGGGGGGGERGSSAKVRAFPSISAATAARVAFAFL